MIKLSNTPEQREIVKAIGSKDPAVSRPASEAYAAAIGGVISQVLQQAGTASYIYTDQTFGEDESPSFPVDLYVGEDAGYITVWSQQIAGGLPSSEVSGAADLRISTYRLDSAVNFLKKYARKHNLNVLSKATARLLQEVLIKQERMAWSVICRALGEASTKVNGVATKHTITSSTQDVLQLDDFNRLMTLAKRLSASFAGGTSVSPFSKGATDLFLSPEMKEQIRGMAYQPQNTRVVPAAATTSSALGLPDSIRESIFNNAGIDSFYGLNITELNELGRSQKYNVLFGNYATNGIAAGAGNFNTTTDELVFCLDLTKEAFVRAVEIDDVGSTFTTIVDDQWPARAERVGFYGAMNEGRLCWDARSISGIVV